MTADVLIIGAGPAGLACAATVLAGGCTVELVDAGHGPGGQYWRHPAPGSLPESASVGRGPWRLPRAIAGGRHPAYEDLHHDLSTYRALLARLEEGVAAGRAVTRFGHDVWSVTRDGGGWVAASHDRGTGTERRSRGRAALIATGAHDVTLPFPGWDLPGVFTVGALQALLKGHGVVAGRRVLVAGTGPFLLPVATGLARYGADVVGLHEAGDPRDWAAHAPAVAQNVDKVWEGMTYAASLARHRIPVRARSMVVAAHGDGRVESVTVAAVGDTGSPVPGSERSVNVDAVGIGWGFSPIVDLAVTAGCRTAASPTGPVVEVDDDQASAAPGLFVAGETTGIGGALLALREGELAAHAMLDRLGRRAVSNEARLLRLRVDRSRLRAFATAMLEAHPLPAGWAATLDPDTVVCRCEEVPYAAVRRAVLEDGAQDVRQVKQLTRAGMGWCQGRVCEPACRDLVRALRPERPASGTHAAAAPPAPPPTERLVALPIPLGALADSDLVDTQ